MSDTSKDTTPKVDKASEVKVEPPVATAESNAPKDAKPIEGKPAEDIKPPKSKGFSNPALRAMGIPTLRLPSRNWSIFWLVVTIGAGGIIYDRYQQSQIRKKWMKRVEHFGNEPLAPNTLARNVTVYIAPPPSDYLDESMSVFRKYVKPILNSAGVDFTIQSENRQGVIRSIVAAEVRALRREILENEKELNEIKEKKKWYNKLKSWISWSKSTDDEEKEKSLTTKKEQYQFDYSSLLGVYYENSHKGEKVINEDAEVIDASANGGVICIGRGAYKEYLTGLHEGLLGPLDKPIENNEFEATKKEIPSNDEVKTLNEVNNELNLPTIKDLNDITQQKDEPNENDANIDKKINADELVENNNNTIDESKKENDDDNKKDRDDDEEEIDENGNKKLPIPKPFIKPEDYSKAKFPSELNFNSKIQTKNSISPIFQQSIVVIPVYHLLGFLNTPQRIYRFYTRRYLTESYGKSTVALVENLRSPFKLEDVDLAKDEENDWPKRWVDKGIEKNSEWVQELITDERVLDKLTVYDANKVVDK